MIYPPTAAIRPTQSMSRAELVEYADFLMLHFSGYFSPKVCKSLDSDDGKLANRPLDELVSDIKASYFELLRIEALPEVIEEGKRLKKQLNND